MIIKYFILFSEFSTRSIFLLDDESLHENA